MIESYECFGRNRWALCEWQTNREDGPTTELVFRFDGTTLSFDEPFHNSQTQTSAACRGFRRPIELGEDEWQSIGGQARAVVRYSQDQSPVLHIRRDSHRCPRGG